MTRRRGFSIVELLVVLTLMGVLVRLGMPRYSYLRRQAAARAIVGDVQAVRVAAYNYNSEKNAWPTETTGGSPPPDLMAYLPAGFDFQRAEYSLDWEVWQTPGGIGANTATSVVIGLAVESSDTLLVSALRSAARVGIPFMVTGARTTFLFAGFGGNY